MKGKLLDFGYQNKTLVDFVNFILANDVNVVFDVRENAENVRKFRREDLERILSRMGVEYVWAKELGNPYRRQSKKAWEELFSSRLKKNNKAKSFIDTIVKYLKKGKNVCLLCYEEDRDECHRRMIIDAVLERLKR
ncbi:MAG: DUF488 family protein, N3 subclade [Candidatus Freyarchaeota archaeon]